jgi:hydroxymethylbilane synthase
MVILGVEISHKLAPLALRERLSFPEAQLPEALHALFERRRWPTGSVLSLACDIDDCLQCPRARSVEAVILSTCNRTGIYALGQCPEPLARFLVSYKGCHPRDLRPHLGVYESRAAVEHLFAVAAGLDSQVLGEPQILGQVRRAHEVALQAKAVGPILDELFRRAIHVGKRVRRETELGRHPASLASAAVELVARTHPDISQASALLIGTGEMGELVARLLRKRGICQLIIASRSLPRAAELAHRLEAQPLAFERVMEKLPQVDILISATDAPGFVLTAADLKAAQEGRKARPLLLIDLGVPRNLDPEIRRQHGAQLHDLDDLKALSDEGLRRRQHEVPKAWTIVREETEMFMGWLRERRAAPLIRALHDRAEAIRREQLQWALPKLGPLDEHQRQVIEMLTSRIVGKLLHPPTAQLRAFARTSTLTPDPLELAAQLFRLSPSDVSLETQADAAGRTSSSTRRRVIVGTRGSALALAQTQEVLEQLKACHPAVEFVTKVIRTSGDRGQIREIGAFVKELEDALQRGEIDLAVHSLKDLPTQLPGGLVIAAVPRRADSRDVLISRDGLTLKALPQGARLGTGSPRRMAQLLALRGDLEIVSIRGNVDTRLRKLKAGEVDALVLAAAGLERLGLINRINELLSLETMLPAVGQGALAVEVRADDGFALELVKALDHPETRAAVTAERAFLQALGGGCRVPIAAHGRIENGELVLDGLVAGPDARKILKDRLSGSPDEAETQGRELAERLLAAGAAELLAMEQTEQVKP